MDKEKLKKAHRIIETELKKAILAGEFRADKEASKDVLELSKINNKLVNIVNRKL